MRLNVGYLVSYDYEYLLTSIKPLYDYVDKIVLAIDQDRLTWGGNAFEIPESFFEQIRDFDTKGKIECYFDKFYVPALSPMECETRERNLLLQKMGKGWNIQLDVDEYFYDFPVLVRYLRKYWFLNLFPKLTPIQFKGVMVTLFKEVPDGYLYIENNERFPFLTNAGEYVAARSNKNVKSHMLNMAAIHQSWARPEHEILTKVKNWGHRDDFDTMAFFKFWQSLNSDNYKDFKNFHPQSRGEVWDELKFIKAASIDDFIEGYSKKNKQKLIGIDPWYMVKTGFKKIFRK